jgi:hypothetical protein
MSKISETEIRILEEIGLLLLIVGFVVVMNI